MKERTIHNEQEMEQAIREMLDDGYALYATSRVDGVITLTFKSID